MDRGIELYERVVNFDYANDDLRDVMVRVWSETPYMLDAFTDGIGAERYMEMKHWLRETFGDECFPLHGRDGRWQFGSATIHGWTHVGFKDAEARQVFVDAWPDATEQPPGEA